MRRTTPAILLAALLFTPAIALAHGPGGAALRLLSVDAEGAPDAVRLTTGIALRVDAQWRFICPAAWGGLEIPPAASTGQQPIWLMGTDSAWLLDSERGLVSTPVADLSAGTLFTLDGNAEAVFALTATRDIWRLEADGTGNLIGAADEGFYTMTALDDALVVARTVDQQLEIQRLSTTDGSVLSTQLFDNPEGYTPQLRDTGGRLFISLFGSNAFALAEITADDLTILATSEKPLLGPAITDTGALLFTVLGILHIHEGSGPATPIDTDSLVACAGELGGVDYTCLLPDLHAIDASGIGAPIFRVADITPPETSSLDPENTDTCEVEWLHFTTEAGIDPDPQVEEEVEPVADGAEDTSPPTDSGGSDDCACSTRQQPTAPGGGSMLFLILAAAALAFRGCVRIT